MPWDPLSRLSADQQARLAAYADALLEQNRRVNLISRADTGHVFEHHILHSLALTLKPFPPGSTIADWGTGGGLPAIPLAIAFPECRFIAVDSVEKKIRALTAIVGGLGLENVEIRHGRAEQLTGAIDYSVSRATAPLSDLWSWHERLAVTGENVAGCWRRGLLCLKGGDLTEEISRAERRHPGLSVETLPLGELLGIGYYEGKVILECSRTHEPEQVQNR